MKKNLFAPVLIAATLTASLSACATPKNTAANAGERVWVINTFTMKAGEKPETVADLQLELVEKIKNPWPGFVSQQTLISQDGKTVSTIEVWENFDTLKAIAEDSALVAYRHKIQQHATSAPVVYRLAGSTVQR